MTKYGGVLILLAMSSSPKSSVEGRLSDLKKGINYLTTKGISKDRIIIDPLVMPASTQHLPKTTLQLINIITQKLGFKTTIGLSNLSHGLPDRSHLNASFCFHGIIQWTN